MLWRRIGEEESQDSGDLNVLGRALWQDIDPNVVPSFDPNSDRASGPHTFIRFDPNSDAMPNPDVQFIR